MLYEVITLDPFPAADSLFRGWYKLEERILTYRHEYKEPAEYGPQVHEVLNQLVICDNFKILPCNSYGYPEKYVITSYSIHYTKLYEQPAT